MKTPGTQVHKNYTLADIARETGISSTAVSMALRNSGGVSDALRNRVLAKVKEMNYVPALAARVLRGKHTGQLGLYLPLDNADGMEVSSGFFMPIMAHFVSQCEQSRYSYHIELSGDRTEFRAPAQLTGRLVDGLLLAGKQDENLLAWLDANPEYKWVSVMEQAEYCVLSGNRSGIYRAVEYLAALGHRKIAFVHCSLAYDVHATAREGYYQAVGDFNLRQDDFLCREIGRVSNRDFFVRINEWCEHIFAPDRRPTAIICNDLKIANAVMMNAAGQGLKVPDDLSLIAYGTKSAAERIYPFVTTVEADFHAIMEKCLGMLIKRIENNPSIEKQVTVEAKLVKRDSVAVPRGE